MWRKLPDVRAGVAKIDAVSPIFARVVGELWAADPSKCPRGYAADAGWGGGGAQSEAPR